MKALKILSLCVIIETTVICQAHSKSVDIYIFTIDDRVLMKLDMGNEGWVEVILDQRTEVQGNMSKKFYSLRDSKWKEALIRSVIESSMTESPTQGRSAGEAGRFTYKEIQSILNKIHGRRALRLGNSNVILYDVRSLLRSEPDEDSIYRLAFFGFGLKAINLESAINTLRGETGPILPEPFKAEFMTSIPDYVSKIPRRIDKVKFLISISMGLFFIAILATALYWVSMLKKANRDIRTLRAKIKRFEIVDPQRTSLTKASRPAFQDLQSSATDQLSVILKSLEKVINEKLFLAKTGISIQKVRTLIKNICGENDALFKSLDERLVEITRDVVDSKSLLSKARDLDEMKKTDWEEELNSKLDALMGLNQVKHLDPQVTSRIGREIVAMLVESLDVRNDTSHEDELNELLSTIGATVLKVSPGDAFNPRYHDLVVDDKLVTDREQRVTKVISRGIILPDGSVVKAKVSIQR